MIIRPSLEEEEVNEEVDGNGAGLHTGTVLIGYYDYLGTSQKIVTGQ